MKEDSTRPGEVSGPVTSDDVEKWEPAPGLTVADDLRISGTLVWYYCICKRQVWLMSHQIGPDKDDPNIAYGRFLHEVSYGREKKEITVGHSKLDIVQQRDGTLIISEVKKSSRHEKSATMQMLFYLKELKQRGVEARGELRFPEERRRKPVELTEEDLRELEYAEEEIVRIIKHDLPPRFLKTRWCSKCGYAEFCLS